MSEILPGKLFSTQGAAASSPGTAVSQGQSLPGMLLDEVMLTTTTYTPRTRLWLWAQRTAGHGRLGGGSAPGFPVVSTLAFSVAMQEGGSLDGTPVVSGSSQGKGAVALPSEEAAPQQAEAPDTAEQGPGGSNEPDTATLAETLIQQSSPAVVAAAMADASKRGKTRKSSKNAAIASGSRAGGSQAVSRKPLTAQQHAVVAALMVVMKRAELEGDGAPDIRARLICNNMHTMIVLQYTSTKELPSMKAVEHMLKRDGQASLDLLAEQCAAAGFQPLQVFTRSMQCGTMAECRAAYKGGEPLALARHTEVAELHRVLVEHGLPPTWIRATVDQLVRWGALACMAELVMFWLLLLAKLCERCFQPDAAQDAAVGYAAPDQLFHGSCKFYTNMCKLAAEDTAVGYAALDLLFPGTCQFHRNMCKHAALVAGITSVMTQFILYIFRLQRSMSRI